MKNRLFCSDVPSSCLRRVAWVTIAIQAALVVAFTPAIAGVDSGQHVFPSPPTPPLLHTQTYRLADGETVDSVAQKYHLTPAALRQLNQLRTFAHGFDHLQPGDELDVPIAPLPQVQWHDEPAVAPAADDPAQRVAGVASQAGSFLANHPNGEAAAAMARGMATGAASGQLQQWLSRFGTARVQLDADKHFSLKNSQFDLLAPLYDQGDNLLFTQGSLHRTDERTQLNLGAGLRHFAPRYRLGANFFTDYDLSRDHARIGLGVEYWHDFLKLSANGYQRLTGWRDAPELTDYEARPANGWDIRAQAWLPALPQLGGRLSYEQYHGDEVALFGKDQRQRSPYAFTAGIEYTPVPLLAFSVAQRQGKSGENDTRLGVEMHYQLGMPWQQQINPTAVAAMRSLAGSHYALVERNNNIILAYRKKELIRLHTASQVTGYGGEKKSLEVSVTSSHALARIDWSAPALLAAGGKIVQDSAQDYSLVLPAYQFKPGVNHYTVSGVAVDSQGNTSDPSETRVTVQAPLKAYSTSEYYYVFIDRGKLETNYGYLTTYSYVACRIEL